MVMIFILTAVIVLLVIAIIYFNLQFYKEKKNFKIKLTLLQSIINDLSKEELRQQDRIALSNSFRQRINDANAILNKDIFELNYQLFAALSKKK